MKIQKKQNEVWKICLVRGLGELLSWTAVVQGFLGQKETFSTKARKDLSQWDKLATLGHNEEKGNDI